MSLGVFVAEVDAVELLAVVPGRLGAEAAWDTVALGVLRLGRVEPELGGVSLNIVLGLDEPPQLLVTGALEDDPSTSAMLARSRSWFTRRRRFARSYSARTARFSRPSEL